MKSTAPPVLFFIAPALLLTVVERMNCCLEGIGPYELSSKQQFIREH